MFAELLPESETRILFAEIYGEGFHVDYLEGKFGAWQISGDEKKGKVRFKLFFPDVPDPNIKSIQVAGSFQTKIGQSEDWVFENGPHLKPESNSEGTVWSLTIDKELDEGFYEYKYYVTFKDPKHEPRKVSDPFARYGGSEYENAGFVIGGSRPEDNVIAPLKNGRKHLRDLVTYELMIDDFTDEFREAKAPVEAVIDKLDYLKELGINAILFMPWTAWQGNKFNWGYDPYMYFSVEYRYVTNLATPSEKVSYLKKLISECHKRDIHVIMDGVFNHVSPSFPYREFYQCKDQCPYTGDFGGTFSTLKDLNFGNKCTREFIRDVCLYWIKTFGIDGIRFDNTVNFYIKGDNKGLPELLENIQGYLDGNNEKNFSLILEHLKTDAVEVTKDTKATSYWDNLMHEKCFHYLWDWHIDSNILNSFNNNRFLKDTEKVPTIYLGNHDHSHVAWQAGATGNLGSNLWYRTQPYAIALFTSPGAVMIQNGQEFAEDHWIVENDEGSSRRVQPRPLRWGFKDDKFGEVSLRLYKRLCEIREIFPALRSGNFYPESWEGWQNQFNPQGYGVDVGKQVAIYHRWGHDQNGHLQRFIIALNFSHEDQTVNVPFSENGEWTDLLSFENDQWGTRKLTVENYNKKLKIGRCWGHIFYQ